MDKRCSLSHSQGRRQRRNGSSLLSSVSTVALACVLLAFSVKTFVRNGEWVDTQTLAESGLKVNPSNPKVHMTFGNVLAQQVRKR